MLGSSTEGISSRTNAELFDESCCNDVIASLLKTINA